MKRWLCFLVLAGAVHPAAAREPDAKRTDWFAARKYGIVKNKREARILRVRAVKPDGPGQPGTQMSIAELEAYE